MGYRWLRLSGLLLTGALFVIGLSPALQRRLSDWGLIPPFHPYGDQYHRTHLPQFKEENFLANRNLTEADKPAARYPDVHLYTIGDSFTEIDTGFYAGGRNAHVWLTFTREEARLDRSKKNVLVIEILERILRERLLTPRLDSNLYITQGFTRPDAKIRPPGQQPPSSTDWLFRRFNPDAEWRIDAALFDFPVFAFFKEAKASFLYHWYGRVPLGAVSANGQHLFYDVEADPSFSCSSFYPTTDSEVDSMVTTLNHTRNHYRAMGFDEVYYAFVPNKVTALEPQRGPYNRLIERLESSPRLLAPRINLSDTLVRHPDWYHRGDGHWNRVGKRFWLRQVNGLARQWSGRSS